MTDRERNRGPLKRKNPLMSCGFVWWPPVSSPAAASLSPPLVLSVSFSSIVSRLVASAEPGPEPELKHGGGPQHVSRRGDRFARDPIEFVRPLGLVCSPPISPLSTVRVDEQQVLLVSREGLGPVPGEGRVVEDPLFWRSRASRVGKTMPNLRTRSATEEPRCCATSAIWCSEPMWSYVWMILNCSVKSFTDDCEKAIERRFRYCIWWELLERTIDLKWNEAFYNQRLKFKY